MRHSIWWLLRSFWYWYRNDFTTDLEFDMSGATLTVMLGDNTHSAITTNTNLDGEPTKGVATTYASSDPSICSVDPISGALTTVAVGTAEITETSTRSTFSHTDSGTVTVTANPADDFNTALTFS